MSLNYNKPKLLNFCRLEPLEIPPVKALIPDGILEFFNIVDYFNTLIDNKNIRVESDTIESTYKTYKCICEIVKYIKIKYDCVCLEDFKIECEKSMKYKNTENCDIVAELKKIANDLNIISFIFARFNNRLATDVREASFLIEIMLKNIKTTPRINIFTEPLKMY